MYKKLMMILIGLYACANTYFQMTSASKASNHHALVNDRIKIEDIKNSFIRFYESPAGERYHKLMPDILKESVYIGIRYGEEIAKRIMKRLKDKEN